MVLEDRIGAFMNRWSFLRPRTLAFWAIAALTSAAPAAVAAPVAKTIVFAAVVSLSGSTAHEGTLTKEGYDFWMGYVNGHGGLRVGRQTYNVVIRYADDGSDPAATATRLQSLITQQHVDFILGPYGSGPTFTAAAVAERNAIPMVDSGGAAENIFNQGYSYTVNVMSPARKYLVGIIEYAVKRKPQPKTIAISAASDAFSLEVQQGAVQSANDHGIRVVYADRYTNDPASITAAAAAIKAAAPDIVLNAGHFQDALLMHRALKEQHVRAMIYGYTNGPDVPEFRSTLGNDAEDVLGSAQWSAAVTYEGAPGFYHTAREYAAAFNARVGHAPDYHNAEATAAGLAFQYALARAGTTDRLAVRNALAHLDVVTFFGLLKFDARGVNVFKPMVVNQVQHEQLVTIYPYRLANATPVYPAPAWVY
jgi:branched-chain amino acid transport system substrate-binding protein